MCEQEQGEKIASDRIYILDGSFGSQLNKYMEKNVDGDPLWSARALSTNPEAVKKVHMDYIRAGSDIIQTNTYQASINGFMKYLGITKEASFELLLKAVDLVRDAIDVVAKDEGLPKDRARPLIAGSIGPYGAYLHDASEYDGSYTDSVPEDVLKDYHKPRIEALAQAGVDLFAIETIPSKKEAELLVELIKDHPDIKTWLSFSCRTDGTLTAHGDGIQETVRACYAKNPSQIIAVGVNCIAPYAVELLLKEIKASLPDVPLIVYANSGENYSPSLGWDNKIIDMEIYIPTWLDLGVKYIGGCCRVCDNYIRKIEQQVEQWKKAK